MCRSGVFAVVLVSNLLLVCSFNIDTFNYVQHKHKGVNASMFGFSVATHIEQGTNWIIVGAPEAQSDVSTARNGGVVYKCITTRDDGCDEIIFNDERSERDKKPIDDKNYQWFGASVSSAGPNLPIVACASRYVWFTKSREERRDPVGTCYITKNNFRDSSEYSPCRTSLFGYHRQGSCQAGFSAGMSKDGRRLFIGAPGSWYWQGQTYSIDPQINFPFTPGIFGEAFGFNARPKGQVFQQSLDKRPAVVSTPEGPPQDDDSYMGYSMVIGDFNNEGIQGVAVGMPKGGEELEGRILLYTWNLTNYLNITGSQLGAYFGYALANSDVDGDKKDDLIIGAPLHTEKNTEGKYEVGRVVIACQGFDGSFTKRVILDGFNSKSRFGLSLSTLGDINLDGYGDFAVGAPYDGPFGGGAVYIFLGAPNADIKKYSQVIYAEDVQKSYMGPTPVTTFGFSIAGGLDLDRNDYPDLAIGAYLSDVAYFFRTRPVVKVEAYAKFLNTHKQLFLDKKDCKKPGFPNIPVTCTNIQVCFKYTGKGAPSTIELDIQYFLDAKKPKQASRMYLEKSSERTVNTTLVLNKNNSFNCDLTETVYLEEKIVDKLTELVIEVSYSLRSTKYIKQTIRNPNSQLIPILDQSKSMSVNDSIGIYKYCGTDNVCIPDLHLDVHGQRDGYVHEFGKSLKFIVEVTNHAEDAYNAKFYLHLPKGIGFKVAKRSDPPKTKVSCVSLNETLFVCDIGNPLSKVFNFELEVEPLRNHKFLSPSYDFIMNVTSANPELPNTLFNNEVRLSIQVLVNVVLSTEGKSVPPNVYYNLNQYPTEAKVWDTEVGPSVLHSYTVTNKGPSDVQSVEIFIIWPHLGARGKDLLYLLEEPHTLGDVQCERVGANYNGYTLAGQRDVWDILDINPNYVHSNATPQVQHPNQTIIQGQVGNTITTTETDIIYYDENKNVIHKEQLIGEPDANEYWQQISKFANNHFGPLTVSVNTTIHVKYENGTVVSHAANRPGTPEVPYMSYEVHSKTTTLITYTDSNGNILYEEIISEEPGSESFTKRVRSTTDRYAFPVAVRTNTTRETTYMTQDGKILHREFFSKVASGETTNIETSKTKTVNIVVLYNTTDGSKLDAHVITAEPNSKMYWDTIDKLVKKYSEPVTIHTSKINFITYYVNGVEVRTEEVSGSNAPLIAPFRSNTDTTTTITCYDFNGNVLEQKIVSGDSETKVYTDAVRNITNKYKQPITVKANITTVITYRTSGGKVMHTGFIYEEKVHQHNQNSPQLTTTIVTTIVTIYDSYGNEINKETITKEPNTPEYWESLNQIVSHYEIPIKVDTSTTKKIIYYINGIEVGNEEIPINANLKDKSFIIHTEGTTTITCTDENKHDLYKNTIPGNSETKMYKDIISNLINQHPQPIIIKTNSTKLITYRTQNGQILHTGTVYSEKTELHNQNQPQTSVTTITTTVTVYDSYGTLINTEVVTDEPGTPAYWQKINKIIAQYTNPVTVSTTSIKTITYYINGNEVNKEEVPVNVTPGNFVTNHVETTTTVTCTLQDGTYLTSSSLSGDSSTTEYRELIAKLIATYTQPITITTKVTKTIQYKDSVGNVIYTGTTFNEKLESFNLHSGETTKTSIVTIISVYDNNGAFLDKQQISEEPGTSQYWEEVNKIVSRHTVPVTMKITTNRVITYYVNNVEVRKDEKPFNAGVEVPAFTRIESHTRVTCRDKNGKVLNETTIFGDKQTSSYKNIISTITRSFRQPIFVTTSVKKTIKYLNNKGITLYTGITHEESTESYNQNLNEATTTITESIVTFYDENRNFLQREIIRETPGSSAYWEEINKIVSKYNMPVTIRISVTKTIIYYINGVEIRREQVPDSGTSNEPYTTQVDVKTEVFCYANDGNTLYHRELSGNTETSDYNETINFLKSQYAIPLTIKSNTTKVIKYLSPDRTVIYAGYVYELKTQKLNQHPGENSRISTITIVTLNSIDGGVLEQLTIIDAPGSPAYWDQINNVVVKYHEIITIRSNTKKVITYYVNGKETRSEQITGAGGSLEDPFKADVQRLTTVTVYGLSGNIIGQQSFPTDRASTAYLNYVASFKKDHPNYHSIHSNVTVTIYYRNLKGIPLHVGTVTQQSTEVNKPDYHQTSQTITITTITFYDSNGNPLKKETIRDEPGSQLYWESIKSIISLYPSVPLRIHTTTSKIITYLRDGQQVNQETVPGNAGIYETPFTSHVDITNIITFYGSNRQVLQQETVKGELSLAGKQRYLDDFSRSHAGRTFTMETNTTKVITYRSSNGEILFTDNVLVPGQNINANNLQTKTTVKTTFTVYGPDRRSVLDRQTIDGEPGSSAYNDYIARTIARFPGSITIYTNSTKTITLFTDDGQPRQQIIPEPRSTIHRASDSLNSKATTSITFYGPDGKAIHHDTISGAPGNELITKLNEIAKTYGGIVRNSAHQTPDDDVEGSVSHVDTPYPGNKFENYRQRHFTDFDVNRGYSQNYSSSYANHSFGPSYMNLQDINHQGLGQFAKKQGYVDGGINMGVNNGHVDRNFDYQARSRFENKGSYSNADQYNYLRRESRPHNEQHHGRTKREDSTTNEIKTLSECKTSNCSIIRCTTGPLHNGDEVHITLRARINVQTVALLSKTQTVKIQSMLLARISQFEEISGTPEKRTLYRQPAITKIMPPEPDVKPDIVPLWIVILSAVAGTLILLLLIFLLYKCGFFNRSRPSDAPERQPLNRNGHFQHGDEAL